jgi:outer membrane protein TolC
MKKIIVILSFLVAVMLPLSAEQLVLTVEESVELAASNNLNLKLQENILAGKSRAKQDAWNVFLPDISSNLTLNRSNSPMPMAEPWNLLGNISAQLAFSPAMVNGIKQLDLDFRYAKMNLEATEDRTSLGIKKTFYGILLMEQQIDLLEKNIKTMENRLTSMDAMYKNGMITKLDLLKTEASLSSLGPSLTSLENGLEQSMMRFKSDLGLSLNSDIKLDGNVVAVPGSWDADALVENYLPGRQDIQQLLLSRNMLENAKSSLINQSRMPSLALSWSYSPILADPFNSDNWDIDNTMDNGSFSITVSLPIDDWLPHSGTDNKIRNTQDEIDRLDYQKETAFQAAEMEIRSLAMDLNTSREILLVLEDSIEINGESLEMSRESYENGGLTLLDLETSENDLFQAEIDLLSEQFNYISSLLDLEAAVNSPLTSDSK